MTPSLGDQGGDAVGIGVRDEVAAERCPEDLLIGRSRRDDEALDPDDGRDDGGVLEGAGHLPVRVVEKDPVRVLGVG